MTYWQYGAGHRGVTTSLAAANRIAGTLPTKRELVRKEIARRGPYGGTADEIGLSLRQTRMQTQPRCSELLNMGQIADSGMRRKNDTGCDAIVWVLPQYAPEEEREKAAQRTEEEREKVNTAWSIAERLAWLETILTDKAAVLGGDAQLEAGAELAGETRALIRKRILKMKEAA